jgi:hypothetical protein
MTKQENRRALILASSNYQDDEIRQLQAPHEDAVALARILEDPEIGGFDVKLMVNEPSFKVSQAIEEFFADRKRDDLLLLYFSGHGIKDDSGELYLATCNTRRKLLRSTAVSANWINDIMLRSRSQRQVLLLDCCYAGAFAKGLVAKADFDVHSREQFEGRGRVTLTASDSMQYSFEDNRSPKEGPRSLFTQIMIQGLERGEADANGDGLISFDELSNYVQDRVVEEMPSQRPQKWGLEVQGEIIIAKNPKPVKKPANLPVELLQAMESPFSNIRGGIIPDLDRLLHGSHQGMALAAQLALMKLAGDDSKKVSSEAAKSLGNYAVVTKIDLKRISDDADSQSAILKRNTGIVDADRDAVPAEKSDKSGFVDISNIEEEICAPHILVAFCPKCGKKLAEKAAFCPNCGAPVVDKCPENFKKCPRCGSFGPLLGVFCGHCGHRFK